MSNANAAAQATVEASVPVVVGRLQPQYRIEFAKAMDWFREQGHADPPGAAREAIAQQYPDAYSFQVLPDPKGNWLRNIIEAFRIHHGNAKAKYEQWRFNRANHRRSHRAA